MYYENGNLRAEDKYTNGKMMEFQECIMKMDSCGES